MIQCRPQFYIQLVYKATFFTLKFKKLKTPPSKVGQILTFFHTALSCPNGPNIMFQNVAYRLTVYKTGKSTMAQICMKQKH